MEDLFKLMVENSVDGMIFFDNNFNIKYASPAIRNITGYTSEDFLSDTRLLFNIIYPEDKEKIIPIKDKIKKNNHEIKFRLIDTKNEIKWIHLKCKSIPGGYIGIMIDITEKQNALETIKKNEEKIRLFKLIMDNIPEMVWAKDKNGRFIFVNKEDAKFLGVKDTEKPIGKDDMFFVNRYKEERPDRKDWFTFGKQCINSDKIVLKSGKPRRFFESGNVRGRFLYLDVIKAPIFDENGEIIGTVGFGRDVTKEKELENRYRKIFEESQDCIFVTTIEGKIVDINPAGLKLFGFESLEEIKQVDIARDLFKNPSDRLKYIEKIKRNGFVKDFETILKKKDGEYINVLVSATPIFDGAKVIKGFQGMIRDITEKKVFDEKLKQIQKMESIGVLAGGIAHDFNNILTVINGYAEMLLRQIDNNNHIYDKVNNILNAGKKAANLIKQLLAFSKKQIYSPEIVNVNDVIKSFEKMLNRIIEENIRIETLLKKDIPLIKADISQLEQIIMNFIVNAKDALNQVKNPYLKKKIIIETGYATIDDNYTRLHPASKPGEYIFISVSDNGIGMEKETVQRIFEPFFTTKGKYKGTGLGLSVVYGIVQQNGGFITVYSEPDIGTTIKVYWPVIKEAKKDEFLTIAENLRYGNETILVVEDEKDVRELAVDSLKSLGYKVFEAENGLKAIELLKKINKRIDAVITDVIMPELNGIEFVKKAKKIFPELKVIYTSGYTDNHILQNNIIEKDVFFLHKPFSLNELSEILYKLFEEKI